MEIIQQIITHLIIQHAEVLITRFLALETVSQLEGSRVQIADLTQLTGMLRQLQRQTVVSTQCHNDSGNEQTENEGENHQRDGELRPDRRSFQHVIALPDNKRVPSQTQLADYPSVSQTARAKTQTQALLAFADAVETE